MTGDAGLFGWVDTINQAVSPPLFYSLPAV